MDMALLLGAIKKIDTVVEVTYLYVWSLCMEVKSMTAYVYLKYCEKLLNDIQHLLRDEFGIVHSTIQFEHELCKSCYHNKPEHRYQCTMCIDSSKKFLE